MGESTTREELIATAKAALPWNHIKDGNFLAATFKWCPQGAEENWVCPAEIVEVDKDTKTFGIRRLDTGWKLETRFSFFVNNCREGDIRLTMTAISGEAAVQYVIDEQETLLAQRAEIAAQLAEHDKRIEDYENIIRNFNVESAARAA